MEKKLGLTAKTILYVCLTGGVLVVLLPLFWTLLTACKQQGKALQWQFWPQTTVCGEWKTVKPMPQDKATLILEYNPALYPDMPKVNRVAVADSCNNWQPEQGSMQQDGEVWTYTVEKLVPGQNYEYQFVVNGTSWLKDRSNSATREKNSVYTVQAGFNSNTKLTDATRWGEKGIEFRIRRDSLKVEAELKDGVKLSLRGPDADGYFSAVTDHVSGGELVYRIWHTRSFAKATAELYTLKNFQQVLHNQDFPFGSFFLNSLIVALGSALLTVIICTMGGYVFAKKTFWGKDVLFLILLSSMMVPGMIFMIPQFVIVTWFGWMNTYLGMIVPHLANIFGLFLLKQYISTIPNSLFEAARIDGASELQILRIIVVPLSLPVLTTLFLLTFVGQWSNFLWQLIVNTADSPLRTLPVGLALFKGQYGVDWEMMMAGACFSIIPIALLFLAAQKFFIAGLTQGAVKE